MSHRIKMYKEVKKINYLVPTPQESSNEAISIIVWRQFNFFRAVSYKDKNQIILKY